MATVYLGRISGAGGFQRFVGIKRLHPHLAREPELVQMFLDEARLAARIHHPNVVPILEIGASEQGYYIVMEYVEGDSLGELLARSVQMSRSVPVPVAVRIVVDVLAGLHAAHELADDEGNPLGIVHRDVSPQNILIGIDGSARLTDFGVARATSLVSTTRTGQLKGKVAYMAPEQAHGARDLDRRADVFAAAAVLWEAFEGRRLFNGEGEADTLHMVLHEPIPPLENAGPSVPFELEAVLERALDRDRAGRYPTAAAFAEALEQTAFEVARVATHKDVAAYLDATLGAEIAQRRDMVRAFIATSEPARPRSLSMPPPVTSVPPLARLAARVASAERTPSGGASMPMPTGGVAPGASPRSKASVSPKPIASAGTRGRVWPWAVLLTTLVIAVGSFVRWTGKRAAARDDARPQEAPSSTSTAVAAPPLPSLPQPEPAMTAPSLETPEAAAITPLTSTPRPPRSSAPKPAATPPRTSAEVPDDISRNPYR